MSKKDIAKAIPTYKKPVEDVFNEFEGSTTPGDPEQPGKKTEKTGKKTEKKTERISVIVAPELAKDFNDLLAARIVKRQVVEGAIMGKKSKKYSANLLAIEALTDYLGKPEVQKELLEYRTRFPEE